MSGYTMTQAELLYTLPASVTKNTYTTEACMSALAASAPIAVVPSQYFGANPNGVGRSLLLKAAGTIATTSAATFALALGLDTTAGAKVNGITCFTAIAPTAAITAQWELEVMYTCQAVGQSGGMTIQANGKWLQSTVATGAALQASAAAPWSAMFAGNLTGLLASNSYFVELFGTWSASAAGNTTTIQQMMLFGLN